MAVYHYTGLTFSVCITCLITRTHETQGTNNMDVFVGNVDKGKAAQRYIGSVMS